MPEPNQDPQFQNPARFPANLQQGAPPAMMPTASAPGAISAQDFESAPSFGFNQVSLMGNTMQVPRRDIAQGALPRQDPTVTQAATTPAQGPPREADITERPAQDIATATGATATSAEAPAVSAPQATATTPVSAPVQGGSPFAQGARTTPGGAGFIPYGGALSALVPGADHPLYEARLQAAARGDYQSVLESYLSPETFSRNRRALEAQASAPISFNQSLGSFANAAAQRNFAQRRLLAAEGGAQERQTARVRQQGASALEAQRQQGALALEGAREGARTRRGALEFERAAALEGQRQEGALDRTRLTAQLRGEEAERQRAFQLEQGALANQAESQRQARRERERREDAQVAQRRAVLRGVLDQPLVEPGAVGQTVRDIERSLVGAGQFTPPPPRPADAPADARLGQLRDGTRVWVVERNGRLERVD